jgi:hypothetical protein
LTDHIHDHSPREGRNFGVKSVPGHRSAMTLEGAARLALLPFYVVMAVLITVTYAIAVLVVEARS